MKLFSIGREFATFLVVVVLLQDSFIINQTKEKLSEKIMQVDFFKSTQVGIAGNIANFYSHIFAVFLFICTN